MTIIQTIKQHSTYSQFISNKIAHAYQQQQHRFTPSYAVHFKQLTMLFFYVRKDDKSHIVAIRSRESTTKELDIHTPSQK